MSFFTPNIPRSGQTLGNSRPQVLNNFASLRNTISQGSGNPGPTDKPNHVDVNAVGAGKHIFVQMPVQTTGVANLPANNEGGMITRTISGSSELFYVRDNVSTYYQMTGPFFSGQGALAKGGTTMLFGGIVLKWGQISTAASSATITFATECGSAFPTNCLSINLTRTATGSSTQAVSVTSLSNTQAVINTGGTAAATVYFIAIGN